MFSSFFPSPRYFFPSVVIFTAFVVAVWYFVGHDLGAELGWSSVGPAPDRTVGLQYFVTPQFLWFYCYLLQ